MSYFATEVRNEREGLNKTVRVYSKMVGKDNLVDVNGTYTVQR